MPYAEVRDLRMYYEEHGRGEPLVLLHGGPGAINDHPSGWGALLPAFAERYRAIPVEHRGHGRTNNPAGYLAYAQIAADIAAFVERLGLAPVNLAGVSDGAVVALTLGMNRPDLLHSLVCVGAFYRIDDQIREAWRIFDPEVIEREAPEWAASLAATQDPHHYPGYWRDLVEQLAAIGDGLAYAEADLRRIPVPTLLVAGEADRYANLDQMLAMRRGIPRAEMLILNHAGLDPGANHVVQHTRAGIVGPVVLEFLGRHAGSAPGLGA
jgi:pimeloyl-ACP methyl ester carboxylesterase